MGSISDSIWSTMDFCALVTMGMFLYIQSGEIKEYKTRISGYESSLQNLSVTRHETNGVDYLLIPFNGKEIKLFQYNGTYQTSQKIAEQEMQKAARQAESNLVEITGGKN